MTYLFDKSCSEQMDEFFFNSDSEGSMVAASGYIHSISTCCLKATKIIRLENLVLQYLDLSTIMKCSYQCETVAITSCMVIIEEQDQLNFVSDLAPNIEILDLHGTATKSNWNTHHNDFDKILTAIAESPLRDSLKKINLSKYDIKAIPGVQRYLIAHGLVNVKAVVQDPPKFNSDFIE